jgi:hypothetical protein
MVWSYCRFEQLAWRDFVPGDSKFNTRIPLPDRAPTHSTNSLEAARPAHFTLLAKHSPYFAVTQSQEGNAERSRVVFGGMNLRGVCGLAWLFCDGQRRCPPYAISQHRRSLRISFSERGRSPPAALRQQRDVRMFGRLQYRSPPATRDRSRSFGCGFVINSPCPGAAIKSG